MFRRTTVSAVVTIAVIVSGCDTVSREESQATEDPGFTLRDSAGIGIVDNHAPEHPAESFWTIDPEPEFVLGGSEDLSGLANDSAQLIWRVVDGSFLAGVPDLTVDESPGDCSHLAARGMSVALMGSPLRAEGMTVHGEELLRIDDAYVTHSFGCARPYRTHLAAGGDPPFVYVSNDHTEIRQHSLDGTLVRIIRRTAEPPPVTDKAWNAELVHRARNRAMDGWPPRTEDDEPIPRREKYPAIASILVDASPSNGTRGGASDPQR